MLERFVRRSSSQCNAASCLTRKGGFLHEGGSCAFGIMEFTLAGAWNLGQQTTLSGWLSSTGEGNVKQKPYCGLTLGSLPKPSTDSWAVSVSRSGLSFIESLPAVNESSLRKKGLGIMG